MIKSPLMIITRLAHWEILYAKVGRPNTSFDLVVIFTYTLTFFLFTWGSLKGETYQARRYMVRCPIGHSTPRMPWYAVRSSSLLLSLPLGPEYGSQPHRMSRTIVDSIHHWPRGQWLRCCRCHQLWRVRAHRKCKDIKDEWSRCIRGN